MMICSCGDFANRNGTQMALCQSGNRISPARAHLRLKFVTAFQRQHESWWGHLGQSQIGHSWRGVSRLKEG
jgi:hypothetical protein